jgi:pimeloyl-ACP methyl ester carboxylesterase
MQRPSARHAAFRDVMRHGELVAPADAVDMTLASLRCTLADRAIAALRTDHGFAIGDLDRISCPVLLATPRYDRILPPPKHVPRYRREIPGVEWHVLPGCGHVPMWDDTRLVVRTIDEFVSRHVAVPPAAPAPAEPLSPVNI